MEESELIKSTIPQDNIYPIFVLAFGKKLGLVVEDENFDNQSIPTFCEKLKQRLELELKEYKASQ